MNVDAALKRKIVVAIPLVVLFSIIPFFTSSYIVYILFLTFLYAAAAQSWNLLGGYTGQFSFGHAAFFGIGAYVPILAYNWWGLPGILGTILSVAVVSIIALIIGFPCFRLVGPYFSLATLAFGEVTRLTAMTWTSLTGGPIGIGIPPVNSDSILYLNFKSTIPFYFIALSAAFATTLIVSALLTRRTGFYFIAIRERQEITGSLGINPTKYKLIALIISAGITAFCGSLFAQYVRYLTPNAVMDLQYSFLLVLIVVLGGIGTTIGPLIGCSIVILDEVLQSYFGFISGLNIFARGAILVVLVIYARKGIWGFVKKTIGSSRHADVEGK